jgi:hypothetical protein
LAVQIVTVGDKVTALCQSADLAAALEKDADIPAMLKQRLTFDRNGWRFIYRACATFEPDRVLYDFIALRLGAP